MNQKLGPCIEAPMQEDEIEYEATIEEYLGDHDDQFPPVTPALPQQQVSGHIPPALKAAARWVTY